MLSHTAELGVGWHIQALPLAFVSVVQQDTTVTDSPARLACTVHYALQSMCNGWPPPLPFIASLGTHKKLASRGG